MDEAIVDIVLTVGLLIGAVINLLPLPGALSASGLSKLYDLKVADPNLLIMLRHRSAVFAIIGTLLVAAVFRPELQAAAILAGLASAATFNLIAWQDGGYSRSIRRVFIADMIAIVALGAAGLAYLVR